MALLQDCFFCSLSVAASVIGVYTLVAYVIAFFMETWWIVSTPVSLPSPAYVLCAGYLMVSIFSGILLRGLSIKNTLFLLEWLLVVAALTVPEGLLVYFMSIHYWNIRSLYGLMELTCWICRAIVNGLCSSFKERSCKPFPSAVWKSVNWGPKSWAFISYFITRNKLMVSGMICVQSLYSTWREEKEVLRRLRDLNMTRVIPNRRNSVASQINGFSKNGEAAGAPPPAYSPPPQLLNNGAFVPTLRRTASMVSVTRSHTPVIFMAPSFMMNPAMSMSLKTSEFNASQFDLFLQGPGGPQINKSHSLMDLRSTGSVSDLPRKTMSVIDFPVETKEPKHTQSLDRRILKSPVHWNAPPITNGFYTTGRLKNAYFPPFRNGEFPVDPALEFVPRRDLIYGTKINSFYPGKRNSQSKHSLASDSDDFQKYRDIAL